MLMKRDHNNTVTGGRFNIPVLIPATAEEQEGVATFAQEILIKPVRTLKNSDLKNARKHLGEAEALHFRAVIALMWALQEPSDSIALQRAKDNFEKLYELRRKEPSTFSDLGEEFATVLSKHMGLPPQQAVEIFDRKRPGKHAAEDPRWLLSYEMSEAIARSSCLVLWWTGKHFTPAIWCDDIGTAFYVQALLNMLGGKGLRVCPHCGETFFQQRPDQSYCSIPHREAHRVARWRSHQKQLATRKRGKHGTRKAR